jgi:hypothetical protein
MIGVRVSTSSKTPAGATKTASTQPPLFVWREGREGERKGATLEKERERERET